MTPEFVGLDRLGRRVMAVEESRISVSRSTLKTVGALLGLAGLVVVFFVADIAWNAGVNRPTKTASAATATVAHVDLTIVTGVGPKGDWPAYVPSDFTVPAYSTVQIRIVDLDDATALPAKYATVTGTVGNTVQVSPIDPSAPNTAGRLRTVSALDPAVEIGHTFTIPELGLNVPVAAHAVTTLTIKTGAPGVYHWHCYDPCGSGTSGWMGPMGQAGFMGGTMTVA